MLGWLPGLTDEKRALRLIRGGTSSEARVPAIALTAAAMLAVYGVSMGLFNSAGAGLVSAAKLPVLYLATLAVCCPGMYVLNHLLGPRLSFRECCRLLLLMLAVNAAALASYAPVSYFFVLTTSDAGYGFLVAMHVVVFAFAGIGSLGVGVMLLRWSCAAKGLPLRWRFVLAWGLLYALVGSQMSWVLRPWFGAVGIEYALLRPKEGSFFEAVWGLFAQ